VLHKLPKCLQSGGKRKLREIGYAETRAQLEAASRQRIYLGPQATASKHSITSKFIAMGQKRWRKLDGAYLLRLVSTDVKFVGGVQLEPQDDHEDRREAA
jgi:hypothetical protein